MYIRTIFWNSTFIFPPKEVLGCKILIKWVRKLCYLIATTLLLLLPIKKWVITGSVIVSDATDLPDNNSDENDFPSIECEDDTCSQSSGITEDEDEVSLVFIAWKFLAIDDTIFLSCLVRLYMLL